MTSGVYISSFNKVVGVLRLVLNTLYSKNNYMTVLCLCYLLIWYSTMISAQFSFRRHLTMKFCISVATSVRCGRKYCLSCRKVSYFYSDESFFANRLRFDKVVTKSQSGYFWNTVYKRSLACSGTLQEVMFYSRLLITIFAGTSFNWYFSKLLDLHEVL